MKRRISLGIR